MNNRKEIWQSQEKISSMQHCPLCKKGMVSDIQSHACCALCGMPIEKHGGIKYGNEGKVFCGMRCLSLYEETMEKRYGKNFSLRDKRANPIRVREKPVRRVNHVRHA